MADLLYPYGYDEDLRTYLTPDDPRVVEGKSYKVGNKIVRLRRVTGKRPHFWDSSGAGGNGGGGGGPETAAHIFAKQFYQDRMFFYAVIKGQPLLIRFATCVLEQRLDERTPDLTATILECWPPFFEIGSRFLIEIHATNAVDDNLGRRAALQTLGVPCIEVDIGRTAIDWKFDKKNDPEKEWRRFVNYMSQVLATPYNARWIVPQNPPAHVESSHLKQLLRQAPGR